jgi:3-phosphoshikimate 1-carboxyvinyltransferase
MSTELTKMGAVITELEDGLIIDGVESLKGAVVQSYGDHRVAMALAVAGRVAAGTTTTIVDTACVDTSFPGFFRMFEAL